MNKQPWELYPEIWKSESAFFAYLRGGLRIIWSRFPPKIIFKKSQMSPPPKEYTGRAKSLGVCHYCKDQFPASHLEVDHIAQAGSCNSWETSAQFLQNLLDCNDNWVLACKPCHKVKSLAERKGIDFNEALIEKKAIAMMKKPKQEVVDFCKSFGYNAASLSNAKARRKAVLEILKKENNV